MRASLLLLCLVAGTPVLAAAPSIESATKLYRKGSFKAAASELRAIVAAPSTSAGERAAARAYLSAAYLGLKNEPAAEAELRRLFDEQPGATLDEGELPPAVVALAERVRETHPGVQAHRAKLAKDAEAEKAKKKAAEEPAPEPPPATVTRAAKSGRLKVIFLGLTPSSGVAPSDAQLIGEVVQTRMTQIGGYEVIGPSDVAALLGAERQRQLAGCQEDTSCLVEISDALNADRALAGTLGRLGERVLLSLTLLDRTGARVVARESVEVSGRDASAVIDGLDAQMQRLVKQDPKRVVAQKESSSAPVTGESAEPSGGSGLVVGLRGDGDVIGRGGAGGATAVLSFERFGGALTVLGPQNPAVRLEGRLLLLDPGTVRPYLGLGATAFRQSVGPRASAGLDLSLGSFHLFGDVAVERHFAPAFAPWALLGAVGVGYGVW